jgi:hypothetical protein
MSKPPGGGRCEDGLRSLMTTAQHSMQAWLRELLHLKHRRKSVETAMTEAMKEAVIKAVRENPDKKYREPYLPTGAGVVGGHGGCRRSLDEW